MRFARLTAPAVLALGLLTAPLAAEARQVGKVYRIGDLTRTIHESRTPDIGVGEIVRFRAQPWLATA
jgi:hypothetical protein